MDGVYANKRRGCARFIYPDLGRSHHQCGGVDRCDVVHLAVCRTERIAGMAHVALCHAALLN